MGKEQSCNSDLGLIMLDSGLT